MNVHRPGKPRRPAETKGQGKAGNKRALRARGGSLVLLGALLCATIAAYQPVWSGGPIWDDDSHITAEPLRSLEGLRRIWFEVGATQQYYPVVHSLFWVEHRIWGGATLGYHLVNILLHAFSAFLVLWILRRLQVPGAVLAAVIFALHPLQVESVAWISELKNTLSGLLYLGALFAYLRFDDGREKRVYAAAFALFVLALFSKTVTATLPAGLLLILWWRRGSLHWRRDVGPLVPMFLAGIAAGLVTIWVERAWIGARGIEFQFSWIERCLIAGRAVWFYLGKLFLPVNLMFIYPRWQIRADEWLQYLYPITAILLLVALYLLRQHTRAPLAAALYFGGTLFPVLGFIDVYPFRFSFVADHFQYLAGIPVIALFSAAVVLLTKRLKIRTQTVLASVTLILGGSLGLLSWSQCRQYSDAETLYRSILLRNPTCWMAWHNLGTLKIKENPAEAVRDLEEAVRLKPDLADAHNNLGSALMNAGRPEEALLHFQEALKLKPDSAEAYNNLGFAFKTLGRLQESFAAGERSLQLNPDSADAHNNYGNALQAAGRLDEAVIQYREALRLKPDFAEPLFNQGVVCQARGSLDDAMRFYDQALRLNPGYVEAGYNLGRILQVLGRLPEAAARYRQVLALDSRFVDAHYNFGNLLRRMGRPDEAIAQYEQVIALYPNHVEAHYHLGYVLESQGQWERAASEYRLALAADKGFADAYFNLGNVLQKLGRPAEAVESYRAAIRLKPDDADAHNNLGSALEELGRTDEAAGQYREAARLAKTGPKRLP